MPVNTATSAASTDIVRQLRDLPSLPAVVVELLASMESDEVDAHLLGAKIATDQSLTAKTLRLANSSFYGMASKVTSIHQAIAVLGVHSICTLLTACAVTASFPADASLRFNFKDPSRAVKNVFGDGKIAGNVRPPRPPGSRQFTGSARPPSRRRRPGSA